MLRWTKRVARGGASKECSRLDGNHGKVNSEFGDSSVTFSASSTMSFSDIPSLVGLLVALLLSRIDCSQHSHECTSTFFTLFRTCFLQQKGSVALQYWGVYELDLWPKQNFRSQLILGFRLHKRWQDEGQHHDMHFIFMISCRASPGCGVSASALPGYRTNNAFASDLYDVQDVHAC